MSKVKNLITKLKNVPKIRYIAILSILLMLIAIGIPTLARFKNRVDIKALLSNENTWDGTVATSYRSGTGTKQDPYIISNANELAYFEKMLQETSYENTYFELSNDIIINNGTFDYTDNKITYTLNKTKLYVEEYTTNIYQNSDLSGEKLSTINNFKMLNNFKGHFNGAYYSIYGLYITSNTTSELALFNNLKGDVENLYLENILIYGGSTTSSLATTSTNSTIKDIFVDGYIVGTSTKKIERETRNIDSLVLDNEILTASIDLPTIANIPKSSKLTGTYTSTSENEKVTINNQKVSPGEFTVDTTDILTSISIERSSNDSTITLENLKYEITYEVDTTASSAGVIATSKTSTIENIISKANVYSKNNAAGIVGTSSNTDLINAYNTGLITGEDSASGLINSLENSLSETLITNTYNAGNLSGIVTTSFINKITNNNKVTIKNTFNTKEAFYSINEITNTEVNVENVQDVNAIDVSVGEVLGEVTTLAELSTIKDQTNLKETLKFNEYIDSKDLNENKSNVWVYEEGYLPILYFDDLNNPLATLYVGTYSWNDLGYDLKNIYIKNEVGLRIVSNDELNEYKEAYYHIHKGPGLTTREEVGQISTWTKYESLVKITEEGYYTIYVKVIDKNDNVIYINSERLVVDLEEPTVTLSMNDNKWTSESNDLKNINILEKTPLTIEATGGYANVTSIKYHVATKTLTANELESVDWIDYADKIEITDCGNYVVYARVTDAADRVKYVNSDNIVFGGYNEKIFLGKKIETKDKIVNITSKSSVTYNFKYDEERAFVEGDKNNFITDVKLPTNTILTLNDNTTNTVYRYKVTDKDYGYTEANYATYPLENFIKVGQTDTANKFSDESYTNNKKKNISITVDFSKTELSETYTFNALLEMKNTSNEIVVSTLKDDLKTTIVHPEKNATILINALTELKPINYNSDSETEYKLETSYINSTNAQTEIYDTTSEFKKLGLAIKLIDSKGNIVEKKHLKSMMFKVNDNMYFPDNDGIVRINIASNLTKTETILKINTYLSASKLDIGDYNLVITPTVACDGIYSKDLSASSISIPVEVTNKLETNYGFNTTITVLDEDNKETPFTNIVFKTKEENEEVTEIPLTKLRVNISDTLELKNKIVKVSLYERVSTTAVEQEYELLDLEDYVKGKLTSTGNSTYLIENNSIVLQLDNKKFNNNGYELRFEVFDDTRKITTIKKKFIVK